MPIETPFLDGGGFITVPWQIYLSGLAKSAATSGVVIQTVTWSSNITLDPSLADVFIIMLQGNTTVGIGPMEDGKEIRIIYIQDATGGRTVTYLGGTDFNRGFQQVNPAPYGFSEQKATQLFDTSIGGSRNYGTGFQSYP